MIELISRSCVGLTAALVLLMLVPGCDCYHYEYVSFEGQPDFDVLKRTFWPSGWTFWPVPTSYEVERTEYRLEVSTGERPYPLFNVRAFDLEDDPLDISGPDMVSRYGPRIPEGVEEGQWSFDVLRNGEKIGSETFDYEIRSRPFACEWDLP